MPQPLRPATTPAARGCLAGFALIWNTFVIFWMVMAFQSGNPGMMLCGIPHAAVGIGLFCWAVLPLMRSLKLGSPTVQASQERVRLGEGFGFHFEQPIKGAVKVTKASLAFVFRETATYRRGTDTTTVTHEHPIDRLEEPGRMFNPGETIRLGRQFRVPPDAMHTFAATRNKLQWFLKVHVEIAGWPDFKEEYEIQVLPERAG